jgi:integrase
MATFTQLPSGKWRAQVRLKGNYKAATFPLKRDAQAWATQVEAQVGSMQITGFQQIPNGYTLGKLIDTYIEEVDPQGRSKLFTVAMLKEKLGNKLLKNISPIILRDFVNDRVKTAGGVTVAGDLSALGTILKYGRNVLKIEVNPEIAKTARADLNGRGLDTRGRERDRIATDEELEKLYAEWRKNELIELPMIELTKFALATSMRQAEICKLTVEDIDPKAKTALIRDRKDPRRKIGNHQTVPLLPDAWAIVEPILAKKKEGKLFDANERSVSARFTRTCTKLKIKDLHFHDLRHSAITSLFNAGLQIQQVALLSGHKTWELLRRYTHVKAADVHKSFEGLKRNGSTEPDGLK